MRSVKVKIIYSEDGATGQTLVFHETKERNSDAPRVKINAASDAGCGAGTERIGLCWNDEAAFTSAHYRSCLS